jgi:ribosomal protein S18 acetylase RimI-like enzyme
VALGVDHGNKGAYRLYERLGYAQPEADDLRGLPGPVPYDILVADLHRPLPADFVEHSQQTSAERAEVSLLSRADRAQKA